MSYDNLRKGRHCAAGHEYLVTTVTHRRAPAFADFVCARALVAVLRETRDAGMADWLAWVIMPDHVHWLMELRQDTLASCMNVFKSISSRKLQAGQVWQKGYHDHAIRRDESVEHAARYIIGNPLRAGLAERVGEYPYAWCRWEIT